MDHKACRPPSTSPSICLVQDSIFQYVGSSLSGLRADGWRVCPVVVVSVSTMRDSLLSINSLIIIKLRWTRCSFLCLKATLTQNKSSIILTVQADDDRTFITERITWRLEDCIYHQSPPRPPVWPCIPPWLQLQCIGSPQSAHQSFLQLWLPSSPSRERLFCNPHNLHWTVHSTLTIHKIPFRRYSSEQLPVKSSLIFHQIQFDMRKVWWWNSDY